MEQTIAIMKNLLDNHTEGSSEHLGQASIETMMLNLVRSVLLLLPHRNLKEPRRGGSVGCALKGFGPTATM